MFVVPISKVITLKINECVLLIRYDMYIVSRLMSSAKKSINFKSILQQVVADAGEDRIEPVAAEQEEEEEEKADQSSLIEQQFDPELKMRKINELLNMIGKTTY